MCVIKRVWDKKCMMISVLCRMCAEACMIKSVMNRVWDKVSVG